MSRNEAIAIISSFNCEPLKNCLAAIGGVPQMDAVVLPYNQVYQTLINDESDIWKNPVEYGLVWSTLEAISANYKKLIHGESFSGSLLIEEVENYADLLLTRCKHFKAMFVPKWVASSNNTHSILDMRSDCGNSYYIDKANLVLSDMLDETNNVFVVDTLRWFDNNSLNCVNPKLWYMGKVPYGLDVFQNIASYLKRYVNTINGKRKKLIILDLDNTLWGGEIGELGQENVRLGGHDHIGEAYQDFQQGLKTLKNRGILLAICSKNTETIALDAIKNNPEMILDIKDFVSWRINWKDKAPNIKEIVTELNIGMDSVVFIDDSPVERDRVKNIFPEILIPEFPKDESLLRTMLNNLDCFDTVNYSSEDLIRTDLYHSDKKRKKELLDIGDLDHWVSSLDINVTVESINKNNIKRVAQLLNKTNQMNLSTRRMQEQDLARWAEQEDNEVYAYSISDKFGHYGLSAVVSVTKSNDVLNIVDYVISCRVLGRRIEETILSTIVEIAAKKNAKKVSAKYLKTEKNLPCYEFFNNSGFLLESNENTFTWDMKEKYHAPENVVVNNSIVVT